MFFFYLVYNRLKNEGKKPAEISQIPQSAFSRFDSDTPSYSPTILEEFNDMTQGNSINAELCLLSE